MAKAPETKAELVELCNQKGEAWARAQFELATGSRRLWLAEFLAELDIKRRADRDAEQFALQMKSINATEAAAEATRKSAFATSESAKAAIEATAAAKRSAKWTMIAALATAAGVLFPLLKDFIKWVSQFLY